MTVQVIHGDARALPLPDESVDAVVCDPPYNLAFMGRTWDAVGGPAEFARWCEAWASEVYRVLKPGGHLLAFGGTRTYHRMVCGIEDAGFEIRDSITWIYASGFPKSLDVSKAIDRTRNDLPDIHRVTAYVADARDRAGFTNRQIDTAFGFNGMASHWTNRVGPQAAVPTLEQWEKLRGLIGFGEEMDAEVWRLNGRKGTPGEAWDQRPITQEAKEPLRPGEVISFDQRGSADRERRDIPATDEARRWEGWGTALKPASEPVVVARKPLAGTVAQNVVEHGTGALNIDACRVPGEMHATRTGAAFGTGKFMGALARGEATLAGVMWEPDRGGRWPSNIVWTHAPECDPEGGCVSGCPVAELDTQSGTIRSSGAYAKGSRVVGAKQGAASIPLDGVSSPQYTDAGGASRFFPTFYYQAKAGRDERPTIEGGDGGRVTNLGGKVRRCDVCGTEAIESGASEPSCGHGRFTWVANDDADAKRGNVIAHPTVKPLDLMRWLVRLVTPPGGVVLDCFGGSGTTGEAALLEGFRGVLVERDPDYVKLIRERMSRYDSPLAVAAAKAGRRPVKRAVLNPDDDALF